MKSLTRNEPKVVDCKAFLLQNLQKWKEWIFKIQDFISDFKVFSSELTGGAKKKTYI